LEDYDTIISASLLYNSIEEEFNAVNFFIDQIYRNSIRKRKTFLIIREAGEFVVCKDEAKTKHSKLKGRDGIFNEGE
jgi:hypothetical protein